MNIRALIMYFLMGAGIVLFVLGFWFWAEQGFTVEILPKLKATLVNNPLYISVFGLTLVLFAYFELKIKKK